MKNNKNRIKDRPKNNPELRKIKPYENADMGVINGKIVGLHDSGSEKNGGQ